MKQKVEGLNFESIERDLREIKEENKQLLQRMVA
jgi:hypothetical protein